MLANQITQLADSFILHYDAENPPAIKFRGIRNSVLAGYAARGWSGWQTGAVVVIGKELRLYVEKRGKFVLEKLLQVINDTHVDYYAALNDDCKSYHAGKIKPSIQVAKGYLEQIRIEANAASGVTVEACQGFDNLVLGFNAEIDLFCAKHDAKSGLKHQNVNDDNVVFNIGTVHGAVGNVTNSPVTFYDNKTINQLFAEKNISKQDRLELEDILDDLKTVEPDTKKSLAARAEGLIVKHKEALGATAEIIIKTIRAETQ